MAVVRYDPFNMLNQLQRDINQLFDTNRPSEGRANNLFASDWTPAVDVKEENDQFVIHADLPGVDPKDIDITLENGVLTLKGQRVSETKEEQENYRRVERMRGTFLRRLTLPDSVQVDKISARTKDGVLEVIVPKGEAARPRRISVEG